MTPIVLQIHFAGGKIPVRGYKCPVCGEEMILGSDSIQAKRDAMRLGLSGVRAHTRRKIVRNGTSASVNLSPEMLTTLGVRVGDEVEVGILGDRVVITRVGSTDA